MKKIMLVMILLVPVACLADQRTTDFCLEYLKEELQPKPSPPMSREMLFPFNRNSLPVFQNISSTWSPRKVVEGNVIKFKFTE